MEAPRHIPVLPQEVLAVLAPKPDEVYLDCTAGLGGHAATIAASVGGAGTWVLNDVDPSNLERARGAVQGAAPHGRVETVLGNFAEAPYKLAALGLRADMVLADLGFSSNQMEEAGRGFSFSREGPLDMRLNPKLPLTAADLVAGLPEAELARIIDEYGEERHARRVARKLVQARALAPILTTTRLAEIVRSAVPGGGGGIDPATRTFQALRIAVNDELGSLDALLAAVLRDAAALGKGKAGSWLAPGARVAVISFHSLEDRRVKQWVGEVVKVGGQDIGRGVIGPSEAEREANPRARSAKLRAVKLPG